MTVPKTILFDNGCTLPYTPRSKVYFRDGCDDKHKMDLLEAISASVTCISNVGPGFGKLAPDQSFAWVSAPAKLLMALEMLIGRLELYTVMIFFLPSFWKK